MKKYIFLFAAALSLTACSNDDDQANVQNGQRDINFEVIMPDGEVTRASSSLFMRANQDFYVWADQVELVNNVPTLDPDPYFNAWYLKTKADFTKLEYGGSKTYKWPAVNSLRFYAIHGNFSGSHSVITANTSPFPKASLTEEEAATATNLGPLTHTVLSAQDQIDNDEAGGDKNYLISDLLYAAIPTTGMVDPVPLHFYHMLSKIVVKITVGQGITKEELDNPSNATSVKIVNVKNQVTFIPKKLELTSTPTSENLLAYDASGLANAAVRASMLSLPEQTPGEIVLATKINATTEGTADQAAIMVPQTFEDSYAEGSEPGIRITWGGKSVLLPFAGKTFESGKVYTFNITLDHIGTHYGFNPTVTAWGTAQERAIDVTTTTNTNNNNP